METLLMNLFYSGQLKSMAPKVYADDGVNVVIRPLAYCAEEDIAEYARIKDFPIIPCNLCGSQDNMMRQNMKALLTKLQAGNPNVKGNMMSAMGNVQPTHLLDLALKRARSGDEQSPVNG
jgi:tRNA 2-thiocytidine biosynthesis protein TtcA